MNQPTQKSVHVDMALTNMSVNYMQSETGYMHNLFATVPVNKKSNEYFIFSRASQTRPGAKKRTPGTSAAEGGYLISTDTYDCQNWAYRHKLPRKTRANFDSPLNADRASVGHVTQNLLNTREQEFVTEYWSTGIWGTDRVGVSGAPGGSDFQRWDEAGSTPIDDIKKAIRAVQKDSGGFKPNVLAIGADVLDALTEHADFEEKIKYTQMSILSPALLASVLGLDEVIVGDAVFNTTAEGLTESMDFHVPKAALLVYKTSAPALDEPSAGYTFSWSEFDTVKKGGATIKRYYDQDLDSDWYEGESHYDFKVVDAEAGFFFTTAVN